MPHNQKIMHIYSTRTYERTALGYEIEEALGEVLAHVKGETPLSCRIVDDPAAERISALRKRLKLSRQKFADRFGLDIRAVQDWEQGRRRPDRAARVLLTVIDYNPDAVIHALSGEGSAMEGKVPNLYNKGMSSEENNLTGQK